MLTCLTESSSRLTRSFLAIMCANEVVQTFVNHDFLHDLTTSSEIWGELDSESKCIIFELLMENDE